MTILGSDDHGFLRSRVRPAYESTSKPIAAVDLFSGCGGMTLGLAEAARSVQRGLRIALAVEFQSRIHAIYKQNFDIEHDLGAVDVTTVFDRPFGEQPSSAERKVMAAVGSVDFLVGGPPCQGHSNLNNHTRRRDPKNALYLVMTRAAELLEPKHVVIENVPAVLRASEGVVDTVARDLEELGYEVDDAVVPVVGIGIPQLRKRHVLVASRVARPDIARAIADVAPARGRTLKFAIRDLEGKRPSGLYDSASRLSGANAERADYMLRTGTFDLPNELRPRCHRDKPNHRYKSMYGRLRWDLPAHTITSGFGSPGQGRYLHPSEPRTLTPHEAARIQFFPDWFDFSVVTERTVLAEAIGNAVPPKLTFAMARHLLREAAASRVSRELGRHAVAR